MLMSIATAVSIPLYNLAGRLAAGYGAAMELGGGYAVRLLAMADMAILAYIRQGFGHLGAIVLFALFKALALSQRRLE